MHLVPVWKNAAVLDACLNVTTVVSALVATDAGTAIGCCITAPIPVSALAAAAAAAGGTAIGCCITAPITVFVYAAAAAAAAAIGCYRAAPTTFVLAAAAVTTAAIVCNINAPIPVFILAAAAAAAYAAAVIAGFVLATAFHRAADDGLHDAVNPLQLSHTLQCLCNLQVSHTIQRLRHLQVFQHNSTSVSV